MSRFIAKRLKEFDSSKIRAAFEFAEDIPNPIDLSIGFPEDDTPQLAKLAGIEAIKNNKTAYTAAHGLTELREAISDKLNAENSIPSHIDRVAVVPGATTGILLSYLAVLDPGDEVLIPDPYFPPYKELAIMLGAKAVLVDTAPTFQLTAELIKPHITPKTKVLIINSPNNPSGAIYPKSELVKIADLAHRHDLLILSDEVYEHFVYDAAHFSIGSIYSNVLTLNSFSKRYAMTGWRIGYIDGSPEIIGQINELLQYTVFSSSSIGQHAALSALNNKHPSITGRYKTKRNVAKRELAKVSSNIYGGQGAFYFFIKLPGGVIDMDLVHLAAHRGVIVLPGSAFSSHNNYIRVSYAGESERLEEGLRLLSESVNIIGLHKKPRAYRS